MKILVMGLPGSGKTTFSTRLKGKLSWCWYLNGDRLRAAANDWDFSTEGRIRQAHRMRQFIEYSKSERISNKIVYICDFVCPLKVMRDILEPDIVVFMDTIKAGRYEDTNAIFVPPENPDYHIKSYDEVDQAIEILISRLLNQPLTDMNG